MPTWFVPEVAETGHADPGKREQDGDRARQPDFRERRTLEKRAAGARSGTDGPGQAGCAGEGPAHCRLPGFPQRGIRADARWHRGGASPLLVQAAWESSTAPADSAVGCVATYRVGEIGLVPTAAAVANALCQFDGIRRTTLPLKEMKLLGKKNKA